MRIHYNVTGPERKRLVNTIADTIGAKAQYMRMPTYAYEIGCYTVTRDGALEFTDRADSEEVETLLTALEAAGFNGVQETPEQPEEAQEANTEGNTATQEPQHTEDNTATQEPQENGGDSDESIEAVSLTVSIPLGLHTGMSLRSLVNLIYTRADLLNKALGTSFHVAEGLTEALHDDASVLTADRFLETLAAYENHHGKAMIGLSIAADRITFSTLPETADADVLRAFTILCAMMSRQALTQKRIQAKEITETNEKYTMRIWLTRLGMNGPEYKEERRILMARLSGHCAFHTEADKERWTQRQKEKRDALKAAKQAMEVTADEAAE